MEIGYPKKKCPEQMIIGFVRSVYFLLGKYLINIMAVLYKSHSHA